MVKQDLNERKSFVVCLEEPVFSPVSYVRHVSHLVGVADRYDIFAFRIGTVPEEVVYRSLETASLLLLARNRTRDAWMFACFAKEHGIPVVYDIDDYIWEFPNYSGADKVERLYVDEIIELADVVTTPSVELKLLVSERFDKRVELVCNAGDLDSGVGRLEVVSAVMVQSDFFRMPEMRTEFFRSLHDASVASGKTMLLYYFSNDYPDVCTDTENLKIIWMGMRSYWSYKSFLSLIKPELGFVVLREEQFSKYKSLVKYAEFAAHGIVGVYSDVPPYRGFVRSGIDGYLCPNDPASWRDAIATVLSLDWDGRRCLALNADTVMKESFLYEKIDAAYLSLIESLLPERGSVAACAGTPLLNGKPDQCFEAYHYLDWYIHSLTRNDAQGRIDPKAGACRLVAIVSKLWRRLAGHKR